MWPGMAETFFLQTSQSFFEENKKRMTWTEYSVGNGSCAILPESPLMNSPFSLNILWSAKPSPASLLLADCCFYISSLCCYWTDNDARTSVSSAGTAASAIAHLKSEAQGGSEDRCLFYSSFLIFVGSQHTKQVWVLQEGRPFLRWH